ncbi:MAG: segregation/condensation protein A, partial [Rothia mucilaginosa]
MTTNVAAVRVPTPNADTATNARTEGRGLQNPERGFTLTLSNFEGPFDLLLTQISRRKLDITEVALAEVTYEFLAYLHALY